MTRWLALPLLFTLACAPAVRTATLRSDTRYEGGGEAVTSLEVPGDWYLTTKKSDRLEFVAPDNFSRISVSATPVRAQERCAEFAKRAAFDAGKALAKNVADGDISVVSTNAGVADFNLTAPGSPRGPTDRVVMGRAVCREGALAVASCSFGVNQRSAMAPRCERVLDSMSVAAPDAYGVVKQSEQRPEPEAQPKQQPAAPEAAPQPAPEAAPQPAPEAAPQPAAPAPAPEAKPEQPAPAPTTP